MALLKRKTLWPVAFGLKSISMISVDDGLGSGVIGNSGTVFARSSCVKIGKSMFVPKLDYGISWSGLHWRS